MKCLKNFSSALCMILIFSCVMISCGEDNEEIFPTPPTPSTSSPTIILSAEALTLEIGETYTLVASFDPSDTPNKAHTWTSSDPSVVTVDETGLLNALKIGEAVITATALDGGNTAQCKVSVVEEIIPITSITLDKTNMTLIVGDNATLKATITPDNATEQMSWDSSNAGIVSVDDNGNVVAVSLGSATITATNDDNSIKASCEIEVISRGITVNHPEITDVTQNSANVIGSISNFGMTIEESGICYSTNSTPTIDDTYITINKTEFEYKLSGLQPETTYYVRLYAKTDGNITYGSVANFTTLGEIITDFKPTIIEKNEITLTSPAPFGITELDICYGTTPNPTITDNIAKAELDNDGLLHLHLENLIQGTTYYIRPYSLASYTPEYHDNEVSVTTLGNGNGDIVVKYYVRSAEYGFNGGVHRYQMFITIDYEIRTEGLFQVRGGGGKIANSQSGDYETNTIYLQAGSGSFYAKDCWATYYDYNTPRNYYDFSMDLVFTNLETGVRYYYTISDWYENDTEWRY